MLADTEDRATPPAEPLRRRKSLSHRMKNEWDSLLWLFAAFAVFYFTNFASTLVFNELVNGTWLMLSAAILLVSMGCVAYAIVFLPGLQADNWRENAPGLIITATVTGIIGGIW
ncbi:hypothetical protein GBAR_LOCUS8118 [Geodia barretti]|uniref:Uncharacterized protein n=1 Tax=Geodia barretti TaxID=519541 RepID=A0AA35WGH5_GEOBA|nr:hypothetical protein GBAR_LOCUS8118 [Geodia barretti]